MANKRTIELFYDVLSPYSWIAFEVALRYQPVWNIKVDLQPFLLAGIMKGSGNSPPGLNPAKLQYMTKEIPRLMRYHDLGPFRWPKDVFNVLMTKGSLPTMRFLTAAKITQENKLEDLSRELWKRIYHTDEDITMPESLAEVCKKIGFAEEDSAQLLEQSQTDTVKIKLKETTERALNHGTFGSPTILVDDSDGKKQMFFGSDRFHLIADLLGEKI